MVICLKRSNKNNPIIINLVNYSIDKEITVQVKYEV
jgi:hypothetical protein